LNGATEIDERYKWHQTVHILLKELNKTDEDVYKMNYISTLNWLSFFRNRDEVINNRNK
jgi:hypothetical protein